MAKPAQKKLPQKLKTLIRQTSLIYGKSIQEIYGKKLFQQVESLRLKMKESRDLEDDRLFDLLQKVHHNLDQKNDDDLVQIAHCFALYLEIINRAEIAYRRQRIFENQNTLETFKAPHRIIFVFTAHPTEARSPKSLDLFNLIENVLLQIIQRPQDSFLLEKRLQNLFHLLLRTSLAKKAKPRVQDEAFQIYKTVLKPHILQEQINLFLDNISLEFRTWVGGDKDGHPFVNKKVMKDSLQMSRDLLLSYLSKEISFSKKLIEKTSDEPANKKIIQLHQDIQKQVESIKKIKSEDGKRIKNLRQNLNKFFQAYEAYWKSLNSHLTNVRALVEIYPALVMPLEMREDARVVAEDGKEAKKIRGMFEFLKEISQGFDPKWYSRGFIMSMVEKADDIQNGVKLLKEYFKSVKIPLVPLFETAKALNGAEDILTEVFQKFPNLVKSHKEEWQGRFEVMLGYSDSAKENGTLASRYLIAQTLINLDKFFKKVGLTPVFFHGSGGSLERGGGSIRGQTQWWPETALSIFKTTIQGEMVERSFGSPEIMRGLVMKIGSELGGRQKNYIEKYPSAFNKMVHKTREAFQNFVQQEDFPDFLTRATPYQYLGELTIGSRPTQRSQKSSNFRIRAIPWVLCWTQTRVLFPTWWGLGQAYESLSRDEQKELLQFYKQSAFFKNFMNILGFTLAKVELSVFRSYLKGNLEPDLADKYSRDLEEEIKKVQKFFLKITGKRDYLWFRPWLGESIRYRAPLVHILNLIQLISFKRENSALLRETVTGIASGMMTTG